MVALAHDYRAFQATPSRGGRDRSGGAFDRPTVGIAVAIHVTIRDFDNAYMHTGRRLDVETGIYFYRARYYDPKAGRFLQRDPLGYPDGMNRYAAYHVMYGGTDPSGQTWNGRNLSWRNSEDVWIIQTLLNNNYWYRLQDGYNLSLGNFGDGNGIDGDYGDQTRKAVCEMQRYLKKKGYYHDNIDGEWGKNTTKAYLEAEAASDVMYRYAHLRFGVFFGVEAKAALGDDDFGLGGFGFKVGGGLHFALWEVNDVHKATGTIGEISTVDGVVADASVHATLVIAWNIFRTEDWDGMGGITKDWGGSLGPIRKKYKKFFDKNILGTALDLAGNAISNKNNVKSTIDLIAANMGDEIWKGKPGNAAFTFNAGVGAGGWTSRSVSGFGGWTPEGGIGR